MIMLRSFIENAVMVVGSAIATAATAGTPATAIVIQDQVALRAAPRDSARQQAVLWQGEMVEIRGERMDYLQVYDYKRERAGFVPADQVRRTMLTPAEAPELLSFTRLVRGLPDAEALGIGFAAAFIQAAPSEVINSEAGVEALDALGTFADRLARRASSGTPQSKAARIALSAHLEVAASYGVNFRSYEHDGRMRICYDGAAFRRVLAMRSSPEQRARAALALTREECIDPELNTIERYALDEWKADVLDRVDASLLPGYLKNGLLMRRAGVWSSLAYQRARKGEAPHLAANRALAEIAGIDKTELTDHDLTVYNDAAMRVGASRWAAVSSSVVPIARNIRITTTPGQPGETCLVLTDAKHDPVTPLARHCTYGIVWVASATLNREGNALAIAVQPTDTWRELWIFHRGAEGWTIRVLPPAAAGPGIGYAEFAGWVPGGKQMLVVREARGEGKYKRIFELVQLDTLMPRQQAGDPGLLGTFQRWLDPSWKQQTLSLR